MYCGKKQAKRYQKSEVYYRILAWTGMVTNRTYVPDVAVLVVVAAAVAAAALPCLQQTGSLGPQRLLDVPWLLHCS